MKIAESYAVFRALRQELLDLLSARCPGGDEAHVAKHAMEGSIKFADAYVLATLLERHRPRAILEVGSYVGFSTRWICQVGEPWGPEVLAVDPNIQHRVFMQPREVLSRFNKAFIQAGRLEVLTAFFGEPFIGRLAKWQRKEQPDADEADLARRLEAIPVMGADCGRRFDFIFIDGQHHYDAVADNFRVARALLNPGGVIAFHDAITWKGVQTFLQELRLDEGEDRVEIIAAGDVYSHPLLRDEPVPLVDGIGVYRDS